MPRRCLSLVLNLLIFIVVLAAWGRMAFRLDGNGVLSATGLWSLRYFTVLSNLLQGAASLAYAACLAHALRGGRGVPHGVALLKYAGTVSVGLTFLTVMLFLGPVFGYPGMFRGANFWFHLAVPLAAALDFCLLDREGTFSLRESPLAVLPMALYGAGYVGNIARHGVAGNDWYGFLAGGPGWGAVIAAVILFGTWGLALLLRLPRRP